MYFFMNVNYNIILLRFYEQNFLWNLKKENTKCMWDIALRYHALIYGNSLLGSLYYIILYMYLYMTKKMYTDDKPS